MARTARASVGGVCYHVINRGNARAEVFHKPEDYTAFFKLIQDAKERLPMRCLAWCVLPNHFHLVLWPHHDGELSTWMQWLLTAHVRRYHRHYRGSGHVWQGRFKAFPIEEDEHLWTVLRYVERNALRAKAGAARGVVGVVFGGGVSGRRVWTVAGCGPGAAVCGLAGMGQPSAERSGVGSIAQVHPARHARSGVCGVTDEGLT